MYIADKIEKAIKEHKDCTMSNNNTWAYWDGNKVTCQLWNTDVFNADFDNKQIVVKNGGWNTQTTADRINTCFDSLGVQCRYSYAKGGRLVAWTIVDDVKYNPCYVRNVYTKQVTFSVDGWSITWK